eukprot:CAMPEP_0206020334 /NCGR_PEP_ID=MMETSP1464-20131121/30844_1 /ASSEMBLY_ACC=CAM_ASM_001124 /TAXON_ID=119497 /ORGANISM="Exanthemachrysis gayraliae, Strain RCC1523" /LENGTH=61 /DNA_ID=CAMNT_0053394265 /DNA_START=97 /DNA_END=278 /DNA_ORIENTATION=-
MYAIVRRHDTRAWRTCARPSLDAGPIKRLGPSAGRPGSLDSGGGPRPRLTGARASKGAPRA